MDLQERLERDILSGNAVAGEGMIAFRYAEVFYSELDESLAQPAQRSCGCSISGGISREGSLRIYLGNLSSEKRVCLWHVIRTR